MLKEQVGKDFLESRNGRYDRRRKASRDAIHILVLDSVLGSRFSLAQASSRWGYVVDAAATIEDARRRLDRLRYSLIIVDHEVEGGRGLDVLSELFETHPSVCRALVTSESGLDFKMAAIKQADLSFLLTKPFNPEALRRTIRGLLGGESEYAGWDLIPGKQAQRSAFSDRHSETFDASRYHEVLLRGLLAGLNSCQVENEVFELVHSELGEAFRVSKWLWIDEENRCATRVSGDWPVDDGIGLDDLSQEEDHFLLQARHTPPRGSSRRSRGSRSGGGPWFGDSRRRPTHDHLPDLGGTSLGVRARLDAAGTAGRSPDGIRPNL